MNRTITALTAIAELALAGPASAVSARARARSFLGGCAEPQSPAFTGSTWSTVVVPK